jgi:hypothetical protein
MSMAQYVDYRQRRKCWGCGQRTPIGQVYCAACARTNRQRSAAHYAARVRRGQCVKCPNQAEPDRVHCAACLAAARTRWRQQREGGTP